MKNSLLCSLCFVFLASVCPSFAQTDTELRAVSRTYALTNATIVQGPNRKLEHGTLVIKDGLIVAVGAAISVPPDAIVIKADSLFVYAGFIDGLSHTGVGKSKDESTRERPKDPGNPTFERAGITPQADVVPMLNETEKSIEEMRAVGFTVAQVVPYGNMLPGNSAVILLGGSSVAKMVLAGNSSLYAELSPVQGAYPGTVIAVMAKFRELYRRASNSLSYESVYASNRTGLERPVTNRVLQAFYPVIEKKLPVLFKAEKMVDVYRVMTLQRDLGFAVVLGNLKEGWNVADQIKTSNTRVFLSLDLPEDKKDDDKKADDMSTKKDKNKDKEKAKEIVEKKKDDKKDSIPKIKTPADLEKDALEKKKADVVTKYNGEAATFQKAGIHFGFSALTVKSKDIQPNLRRIIAAGLPEDEALASLTTYPAQILGLSDRMGTIDNGKMANLVVTYKPYFNEKSAVRYVFVDGEIYKMETKEPSADGPPDKNNPEGSWALTTETPQGSSTHKIKFKRSGDSWTGTIEGSYIAQPSEVKNIEYKDGTLKFNFSISVEGSNVDVVVEGKTDGDAFTGTSTAGQFGSFPTKGKKDPKF